MIMLVKDIIQEYSVRNKEKKDYPVYSVTNSQGFCKDYFGKEVASKDKSTYKIVPYGCFAYNPSRINVGSIDWQHCENFVIVSPLYNVFTVNTNITRQDYLSYYFKSRLVSDYINTFAKGSVRLNVPLSTLGSFPVPIPPLAEQERIVAELDLLSSIIDKKKAQLKELDQLAQSIFYTMFGDPITNEKGWEMKKLLDVVSPDCSISYGIVQPGEDITDGVPIVRPVDLTNTRVSRKGLKKVDKSISDAYKRTILKGNEILFCVRGTTGVVSFASEELCGCNVTRGITPLSFDNKANSYFIFYLIKSEGLQSIISDNTRGIALKQINMKDVRLLPIILPPLPLQQEFASKIEAIERQKSLIQQSIVETQTLFDSRMEHWFN